MSSRRLFHRPRPLSRLFLGELVLLGFVIAAIVIAGLRAERVSSVYGSTAACDDCLLWVSAAHDAWLVGGIAALLGLAALSGRRWLLRAANLVVMGLLLAMLADLVLLRLLNVRLYWFDIFKFGLELDAISGFVTAQARASGPLVWAGLLFGLGFVALAVHAPIARRGAALLLGLIALPALAWASWNARHPPEYVHGEAVINIVELHYAQGAGQPYSAAFLASLKPDVQPPRLICEPGQQRRPSLILVAWESLSSYHTPLLGGPRDLVPQFTRFSQQHSWFSNFYANGFTTDQGLIALITGQVPLPLVGRYRSLDAFAGYDDPAGAMPELLRPHGYRSLMFTTGDLGFLDKPRWLAALRFDHWEGAEHPFYQGLPRRQFNAADDRALYRRFLQWLDEQPADAPFAAVLLTVETHPPFVDPATNKVDEPAVFAAADAAFGDFVQALEQRGYLDDNLLLVTGDHRSMTPLHDGERARFGESALARVPLVVAGASQLPRGEISAAFQQTDLLPSLRDVVEREACHRPDQGRFLRAQPRPPEWIVHARGDQRSRIDVYFRSGESAALQLAGDASQWNGAQPPGWQSIAAAIHLQRARGGELEPDVLALLQLLVPNVAPAPARSD